MTSRYLRAKSNRDDTNLPTASYRHRRLTRRFETCDRIRWSSSRTVVRTFSGAHSIRHRTGGQV